MCGESTKHGSDPWGDPGASAERIRQYGPPRPVPGRGENGEIGDIMIAGPTTIPGYWRNDAATTALYTGKWLHTGDLAYVDAEGFVHFVDRKKELIKTGGENVYPREVEDVLRQFPGIVDVAVFGVSDSGGWGERVVAAVVHRSEKSPSLEEIRAFCREKIAGYKIPKALMPIDAVPRNMTGKPLKRVLRERFIESARTAP